MSPTLCELHSSEARSGYRYDRSRDSGCALGIWCGQDLHSQILALRG